MGGRCYLLWLNVWLLTSEIVTSYTLISLLLHELGDLGYWRPLVVLTRVMVVGHGRLLEVIRSVRRLRQHKLCKRLLLGLCGGARGLNGCR